MNNYIFPFLWMRGEDEATIRKEMEKIDECGIKAVCVEARPHKDFCGPGWWHDMDIVIDEAKKRDMKIWILDDKHFPTGYANGLIEEKYPERKKQYLACTACDVFGSARTHTLNIRRMMKPTIGFWQIGQPANDEERAKNKVLSIVAVPFAEGNRFHEKELNLMGYYHGQDEITFTLPQGQWRIHVLYTTYTDGGNESYINMIDSVSAHTQIEGVYEEHFKHYGDLFGTVIAGFFSDEPQLGNTSEQGYDTKLGKPGMQLPWSNELSEMLKERCGEDYQKLLVFLFAEGEEKKDEPQIRYDYMDCVSRLYQKNFSEPIGRWCHEHGVEYIGHVVEDNGVHSRLGLGDAHWFRAISGQDMAGIDVIGGQVVYGAPVQERKGMGPLVLDGEFYHYALGKMGASAGHLDPGKKGRTMCELFGAYGWNFGVRDQKRLLDHLLVRGINHLVPHAFSMAQYPDFDCPPHFYAGGNNPEFPYFAELMKYANRMCDILNGGVHKARVAVLYDGEGDWTSDAMPMQKVCRALTEAQIEFDIVCLDMLRDLKAYNGYTDGNKININGETFEVLLVPYAEYLPERLYAFKKENPTFPVYFVGGYPKALLMDEVRKIPDRAEWKKLFSMVSLDEVTGELECNDWSKPFLDEEFPELTLYHYEKDGKEIIMLMNESAEDDFNGVINIPFEGSAVYVDSFRQKKWALNRKADGRVRIEIPAGESCLIMEEENAGLKPYCSLAGRLRAADKIEDISHEWKVAAVKTKDYPAFSQEETVRDLEPYSNEHPDFAGVLRYRKTITLDDNVKEAYLEMEQVYDVVKVIVNDQTSEIRLTPPYTVSVGELLKKGENEIICEVATTPARDQRNYPSAPFDFNHEVTDPTGICGKVKLYLK